MMEDKENKLLKYMRYIGDSSLGNQITVKQFNLAICSHTGNQKEQFETLKILFNK